MIEARALSYDDDIDKAKASKVLDFRDRFRESAGNLRPNFPGSDFRTPLGAN